MASITELEPTGTGPEPLESGRVAGPVEVGRVEVGNPAAAEALAHADEALDELFAAGVCPDDSRDAVVWIEETERLARRLDAARATLVGEIGRKVLHTADGHGSPKIMVRHVAKLTEAEATARAKTARLIRHVPKVAAAWKAGEVSTCAVRAMGRVAANPRVVAAMQQREGEFLADAQSMGAKSFSHKVHRWAQLIDEDGPTPPNERNHKNRDAHLGQNPWDQSWDLKAFLASLQGAEMKEIFDRFVDAEFRADWAEATARLGAGGWLGDGICKDDLARTDAQRRADALMQVFRDAAAAGRAVPPGWVHNIHWSASAYEEMLAAMDADRAPHFDPDTFVCRTEDGHDVDPTEAAANSLVGKVRRVVVDAAGVVIDLGRARRFTGSARTAATACHTHCIWPGCHAPASRCEIDHLHDHGRGGPTSQANAAPLCGKHNRWKQKGFTIQRDSNGDWHMTRPDGSQLE